MGNRNTQAPDGDMMVLRGRAMGANGDIENIKFKVPMETLDETLCAMERFVRAVGFEPAGRLMFVTTEMLKTLSASGFKTTHD